LLREAFDDRGLADAGLADQHGVVLRSTGQHLHGAANLIVTTDDRIELAALGPLREIDGVLLQRLPALFGVRIVDLLAAAHLLDGLLDGTAHRARILQNLGEGAFVLQRRKHEELARNELVAALLRELVDHIQHPLQIVRDVHFAGGALHTGQPVQHGTQLGTDAVDIDTGLEQQRTNRAAVLVEQREHDVSGVDELMVATYGERLRIGERLLELGRQFVHSHSG
jgi:hypothetical protein